jgi:hypothetical protein
MPVRRACFAATTVQFLVLLSENKELSVKKIRDVAMVDRSDQF